MSACFSIKKDDVHIWRVFLPLLVSQIDPFLRILSLDELERSQRFRFSIHRERFVVTRAILRYILSLYLKISPEKIVFSYGPHGKPYLVFDPIYFNTSHSHDFAIYAFSINNTIGIDIEKMESTFNTNVAKRFFTTEEYEYLMELPEIERNKMFYTVWARKEALIKAAGSGFYTSLNEFSCLLTESSQVFIDQQTQQMRFQVTDLTVHPHYQAAFAVVPPLADIYFWEWKNHGPVAWD